MQNTLKKCVIHIAKSIVCDKYAIVPSFNAFSSAEWSVYSGCCLIGRDRQLEGVHSSSIISASHDDIVFRGHELHEVINVEELQYPEPNGEVSSMINDTCAVGKTFRYYISWIRCILPHGSDFSPQLFFYINVHLGYTECRVQIQLLKKQHHRLMLLR